MAFDCTEKSSFENTVNWLRQIELHGKEGVVKVLVANKIDLTDQRVVTTEEG